MTDGAYKQPLPPSRLDPGWRHCERHNNKKTEAWRRQRRTICLRVQSSSRPLQVSIQRDGGGQDIINSRCTGGCAASPCINIDSLCIPAHHNSRGIDVKRRECITGSFFCVRRLKLDGKGLGENAAGFSLWKKQFIVSRSRTDDRTADACLFSLLGAAILFQSCGRCLFSSWSCDEDGSTWMRIASRVRMRLRISSATAGGTNPHRTRGKSPT